MIQSVEEPLYRFRQAIKAIESGEELELIRLRKGDMLQEMKDDFNRMLTALEHRGVVVLKESQAGSPNAHEQLA